MEIWVNIVLPVISGIITCIPLVIQLVKAIKEASKTKNWAPLMQIVLKLMQEAEILHSTGAERKEYVISTIKTMEPSLGFDIDENVVAAIIDSIAEASKKINTPTKEE